MTTAPPVPLRDRLGLPASAGRHRRLVGAHLVDSLGTGLVLAFTLVYFARTTSLSLTAIGAAVSAARLLALPTALGVGPLIDRCGARPVAAAANVVSTLAYTGFLLADRVWAIVLVCLLAQVGQAGYWTASTGLVVLASPPVERTRWFALVSTLRNTGLGVGGALGALLVGDGGTGGLRLLVALNAASYLAAGVLLAVWRPDSPPPSAAPAGPGEGGYRAVLADRRYLLMVAANLAFVLSSMALAVLVALHVTQALHLSASVAGALLVLNGVQVVVTQSPVSRLLEGVRPTRAVAAGSALNALAFAVFAVLPGAPGWVVGTGLVAAMLVYNLAETVATPGREELSVALAHPARRGRCLAVNQLSWSIGQALAPGLLTLLFVRGPAWPWLFLLIVSLAAVPAFLHLERPTAPVSDIPSETGTPARV
ncbi:MFS transporter [Kitasatospora griseola]|uniref:MFS transporter n=1 Tax=Kitasatospora griseola TaxID=2064 RepID=UPI00382D5B6C